MDNLEAATRLERGSDGDLRGQTNDAYWNMTGPWGGITAATLMRAVLEQPSKSGEPISLTVNYCAPISRGEFRVSIKEIRTGRSTQHWSLELYQENIVATASAILGTRRNVWSHQPAKPPSTPAYEGLPKLPTEGRPNWLGQYEFRFARGIPKLGAKADGELSSPLSHLWLNHVPPRNLDFVALAALADVFFVRIFQVRGLIVPVGTISMTTYFHASSEILAAQAEKPLLGIADARTFEKGFSDQTAEIWSSSGVLLASTCQMVHYSE